MPFTGIHDEDMQHRELLEHYGPVYGVPLRGSLPILGADDLMFQALPTRQDLEMARKVSERTAAGYEVLLSHYNRVCEDLATRELEWQDGHSVQEMRHNDEVLRWRGLLEVAIDNAEDIAAGRATELEAKLLEIIDESKKENPRAMRMCNVCLGEGDGTCPRCGGSGYE
jgi:hypothetical protein